MVGITGVYTLLGIIEGGLVREEAQALMPRPFVTRCWKSTNTMGINVQSLY